MSLTYLTEVSQKPSCTVAYKYLILADRVGKKRCVRKSVCGLSDVIVSCPMANREGADLYLEWLKTNDDTETTVYIGGRAIRSATSL